MNRPLLYFYGYVLIAGILASNGQWSGALVPILIAIRHGVEVAIRESRT